ncbi:hypothetical protein DWU98_03350 [Dyella monticola]|uniref:Lipoprotein n=1 Tax=Dyella monticola TaxID=1927958 RepID=A0A370X9D4_9GAMM|nr:hypothetical protein [Dyella monticola]RDS84988.1 hypothetical protein DWU98_03350 [Dyella monticola]
MKQANEAGFFFPWAYVARGVVLVSSLFLFGCNHATRKPLPAVVAPTSSVTGIAACDSYLDTYLACHRAAGTYPADALQTHYQSMRDTLLQEASDPGVRPYLANRCLGLAQQLRDSLHGHSCAPPTSTTTPH